MSAKHDWPPPGTRYTDEEIEQFREQAKRASAEAKAAVQAAGVKLHPRVKAIRAALAEAEGEKP